MPASLSAAFEALLPNGKVLQAWGMTELQFGACSRPSDAREIRFETIGRATPGTELRVADADGRVLPHGDADASAAIATDRGDLDEACRLIEEAGAMEARLKHRDPMQSARRSHRLGLMRQRQGRMPEAVELLAGSAAIHEQVLGESHVATAHRLSDLGAVHYALGNHAEAQRCLRRAIRVHEQQSGVDSPEAAPAVTEAGRDARTKVCARRRGCGGKPDGKNWQRSA